MSIPAFHMLHQRCSFFFVRHGQSASNLQRRIQGHQESPLTDVGREQAAAAGHWLTGQPIERILTSPLGRTRETAQIIARAARIDRIELLPELIELDTGRYSGKTFSELEPEDPDLFERFRIESWEAVPDAERIRSLQSRALKVWEELLKIAGNGARALLCVSHGGMIQWIIKATIGPGANRWMPLFPASNCGIFEFRAETTLPQGFHGEVAPGTGYFGEWRRINHVPYDTPV
jgi:broad specificity phosphatase PhoE